MVGLGLGLRLDGVLDQGGGEESMEGVRGGGGFGQRRSGSGGDGDDDLC